MTSNPHMRKKEPEEVRRRLIECAITSAAEHGLANIKLEAVAKSAGVTKGGLLHHFPSKALLIEAVMDFLIKDYQREIQLSLDTEEPGAYGMFTRACINVVMDSPPEETFSTASLSISIITSEEAKKVWEKIYFSYLETYKETDSDKRLAIIRYAADGIFLADLTGIGPKGERRKELHQSLLAMTYQNTKE